MNAPSMMTVHLTKPASHVNAEIPASPLHVAQEPCAKWTLTQLYVIVQRVFKEIQSLIANLLDVGIMINAAQMKYVTLLMDDVSLFVQDGHVHKEPNVMHVTTGNNAHVFLPSKETDLCTAHNVSNKESIL